MKKSLLALILAVVMLFALSSCGIEDDIRGQISNNSSDQGTASNGNNEETADFGMGKSTGNVYENEFLGLGCKLDSDWVFLTDEEIAQLNGATIDMLDDEMAELMENANVIYDMQATAGDSLAMVSVNFENLGLLYGKVLSEESYVDLSIPNIETAMKSAGATIISNEKATFEVGGKTRNGIKLHTTINGVDIYQSLICIKCGDYMANVAVTTYLEDTTADLLAKFYAL